MFDLLGIGPLSRPDVKSKLIERLLCVAERYCVATDSTVASVSKSIFGRGGHIGDLQAGARDISTGTFERALCWFSDNWPDNVEWPPVVERPLPEAAE